MLILCQASVLAFGLLGGVFLAFSDFIMRALAKTSGAGGPEAMQSVNREVFRFAFMALFLVMTPASLGLAVYGAVWLDGPAAGPIALAGLLYLVGAFGVTAAFNVPLNTALAKIEAGAARVFWTEVYLPRWTFWNSVRAAACAGASVLMSVGMVRLVQAPGF
jgi:uncharacterized membrane protein